MKLLRVLGVLLTLAVAGTWTGCASTDGTESASQFDSAAIKQKASAFRAEGRDFLADRFDDGVVDAADYKLTFESFENCMTSRGYQLTPPVISPADGLRLISNITSTGKSDAELQRDRDECTGDLVEVEAMYTTTAEQVMDAELRSSLLSCIQDAGLKVAPQARNYPEMVESGDQSQEWHVGFGNCLGAARQSLYPDLAFLPVGY